jgi:hypothetical protein
MEKDLLQGLHRLRFDQVSKKSVLRRQRFEEEQVQEEEWREIFKGRSSLRFPRINKTRSIQKDWDHSRPS